jgi:hypothetical protein
LGERIKERGPLSVDTILRRLITALQKMILMNGMLGFISWGRNAKITSASTSGCSILKTHTTEIRQQCKSVPLFHTFLKALLGFRARGRKILEGDGGYQVRDESAGYNAFFEAEKEDIGPENTYLWSIKP